MPWGVCKGKVFRHAASLWPLLAWAHTLECWHSHTCANTAILSATESHSHTSKAAETHSADIHFQIYTLLVVTFIVKNDFSPRMSLDVLTFSSILLTLSPMNGVRKPKCVLIQLWHWQACFSYFYRLVFRLCAVNVTILCMHACLFLRTSLSSMSQCDLEASLGEFSASQLHYTL